MQRPFLSQELFIGLLIHTNVFFLLFSPLILLHAWALRNGIRTSELTQTLILTLFGVALVTILFCLINWSVGRHFLFFKPLMSILILFASDVSQQKLWWRPWSASWVGEALYLSLTLGILCASFVALVIQFLQRNEKNQTPRVFYSIHFQLILAVTIWVSFQTAGHTFLDWAHSAYPLVFPALAAFAAIAARYEIGEANDLPILLIFVFLLVLVIPLSFGGTFLAGVVTHYFAFIKWPMIRSAFLVFVACILFLVSSRLSVITVAVALLGVANVDFESNRVYGFSERHCSIRKQVFDTAIQLSGKLRAASIPFSKVVIWYASKETLRAIPECSPITMQIDLGRPLIALGYDSVERSWNTMPEISAINEEKFKAWATERKVLVVLAQNNEAIREMADRVKTLGFSARIGSAGVIEIGQARLRIDLLSFQ